MATTLRPSPVPTPPASAPPTPPTKFPSFPRLSSASPSIQRNASTSSSRSTTTVSSTSSLEAAAIRPPPIETSTAATSRSQLPQGGGSGSEAEGRPGSSGRYGGPDLGGIGGRAWGRNGPRSNRLAHPPAIVTSSASPSPIHSPPPSRPSTSQGYGLVGGSPTTPRQPRPFSAQQEVSPSPRVTISLDPTDQSPTSLSDIAATATGVDGTPIRGRMGSSTTPSSPTGYMSPMPVSRDKQRTLSVDAGPGRGGFGGRRSGSADRERERRQSQMSNHSHSGSGGRKGMGIQDFVLGEELGQGSYSTVFAATAASSSSTASPTSPRAPRRYAIKIINQQHLVQEKKVKYAKIERDALVRLSKPRETSPVVQKGHKRGLSSSSSGGYVQSPNQTQGSRRRSTASLGGVATPSRAGQSRKDSNATVVPPAPSTSGGKDRLSIVTTDSNGSSSPLLSATVNAPAPHSPIISSFAGRRPSRCAEPPEMVQVPEQETLIFDDSIPDNVPHKPPSPVKEEVSQDMKTPSPPRKTKASDTTPTSATQIGSPDLNATPVLQNNHKLDYRTPRAQTPKSRRASLAPSERSVKSSSGKIIPPHPGVIRLFSTFVDSTSLYFVLDLVSNGELTTFIRKFGSFDIVSARYYAAQLIDTIEFMHDRGVIHRDLKPENILLDDNMRIKVTDFGSAKLLDDEKENPQDDGKKRSFVGSADFVSPEVLRNEEACPASDIWAFGCILFQLIAGKPPFRGATDYLIFQKILKREMEYPPGFDEDAKALIDLVLNLDPTLRPSVSDIKAHAFFATTDFSSIWTIQAPPMTTGLVPPVATLASIGPNSDLWAVFDDEVSDGGFEYDQNEEIAPEAADVDHSREPRFDRDAAAHAVRNIDHPGQRIVYGPTGMVSEGPHVDLTETLDPPRPPYAHERSSDRRKDRGWSHGSSSSGGNRTALSSFLETMRIGGHGHNRTDAHSNRTSRTSVRSDEVKVMMGRPSGDQRRDVDKWSSLLLSNERIIFTSPILTRTSTQALHLPSFLLPAAKRRQLILTDFPRLITVKDEDGETSMSAAPISTAVSGSGANHSGLKIKGECVFVVRPSGATGHSVQSAGSGQGAAGANGVPNRVMDVQEKGSKGFVVQTLSATFYYTADSAELRDRWMSAIKRVS